MSIFFIGKEINFNVASYFTHNVNRIELYNIPGGMSASVLSAAGELPAGELPAGELPAGELPAGELSAGDLPPFYFLG